MKKIKGNLVTLAKNGNFDVIIHGCNCFCTMGAGIAKTIREEWPAVYDTDCKTINGSKEKLGTFTSINIPIDYGKELIVVNAYTQFGYNPSTKPVSYKAISDVFCKIKKEFSGKKIAYPAIGAGLAGGDWERISTIINEKLDGEDHTLVEYDGS